MGRFWATRCEICTTASQLDGLDAAVLLPTFVGVVRRDGVLVAAADRDDPRAVDPFLDEIGAARTRALQRKLLVLFRIADIVGVARDLDLHAALVGHVFEDVIEPRK